MQAMLLAAGLGTRLRPLTNSIPKPLIPVQGIPLIFYNLALLKKYKITDVVINLHYLGEEIVKLLGDGRRFGFRFRYSREKNILGTGGGIQKAKKLLKGPFFVLNADIIIDIDLKRLYAFHQKNKNLATLVARRNPPPGLGSLFVKRGRIISILDKPKNTLTETMAFTGVHVLSPEIFDWLKPNRKQCIIRDAYVPALKKGARLAAFVHKGIWNDLGTFESLIAFTMDDYSMPLDHEGWLDMI